LIFRTGIRTSEIIISSLRLNFSLRSAIQPKVPVYSTRSFVGAESTSPVDRTSVFKNPEGDSAGRLIDAAGLAGTRVGTAVVSTKHANFIQVDPGGRADDVHELMVTVSDAVEERFGLHLEVETRIAGFDDSPLVSSRIDDLGALTIQDRNED
jgi:UDP-N-acetylmuramate dehydrogenase